MRYVESMDTIRERATLLHEDMASHIAEQTALTSNRLTAVASLLLPPSLVAGMLGTNIGGIPGADSPWGFGVLCIVFFVILALEWLVLRRLGWI